MNNLLKKLNNYLLRLLAWFPSAVPNGVSEFDVWATSIIELYDFPNNDSVKFALATVVMHLGPTAAYKPKRYFGLTIKAGAAKQVAAQVFQDIKQKQKAEAEATAKLQVATSESQH